MENMENKVSEDLARRTYEQYMEEGLAMFPPFKGYGLKVVQFAIDEPEMYKLLFWKNEEISYQEYLDRQVQWNRVVPSIMQTFELNETDAKWLMQNMWIFTHGMASLFVSSACVMTMEDINRNLGGACRGLVMQLKAPKDERISMNPAVGVEAPGKVDEYLKGKKNVIVGYGTEKEMYQIRLNAILYFEAVGENVFAYTKSNVYEIRLRLYQVEEYVKNYSFMRISKSLVVNLDRIASIMHDAGGRGKVVMLNGETVIASRSYFKNLVESVKSKENI